MLYFKSVPVVIEPGVGALEVGLVSVTKRGERVFYVPFERVQLTAKTAALLPMIAATNAPHVFSMRDDLKLSPFLLIYDNMGKLCTVYTREPKTKAWLKNDTAPEQIGDTVTQFSVRFSFDTARDRDQFLDTLESLAAKYKKNRRIVREDVAGVLDLLTESRSGPVVLPVAIAKPTKPISV